MKHVPKGQETITSLQRRIPEQMKIGGQVYINFRDVIFNLLLNNIQQVDFSHVTEKIQNYSAKHKVLSPRHRRRVERQLKKMSGIR